MKVYARFLNDEDYLEIGGETDEDGFYSSLGFKLMDVEQGYDGAYYPLGKAPAEPLSLAQEQKHSELKSTMQSKRQALKVDYDDDQFDANEDAQANMIVLLKSFDLGATSVSIRSTTEKTHTFNKDHTQELSLLMLQAVNELYDKYWELKDQLSKCETVDAVNEIKWE